MLVGNINCYVCDCAEDYVPFILLTAYSAAGLRVNMLKNNIEFDIKETALIIKWSGNKFINTYSKYGQFHSRYLVETMNILPS